jgi:hypothetical protein
VFVVVLAGLQAVVELAEKFVEQVPLGLVVPVSGGAAGVVVTAGAWGGAQRSQGPDGADGGQPLVFDMPVQHNGFLATGAGDGGGSGEGFEPAGVSETVVVVADLSQNPGAGKLPRPGKLVMISASGCCSKCAIAASASSSAAAQAASNWRSSAPSWIPIAFSTWGGWRR